MNPPPIWINQPTRAAVQDRRRPSSRVRANHLVLRKVAIVNRFLDRVKDDFALKQISTNHEVRPLSSMIHAQSIFSAKVGTTASSNPNCIPITNPTSAMLSLKSRRDIREA
jgi:hypothetical protein